MAAPFLSALSGGVLGTAAALVALVAYGVHRMTLHVDLVRSATIPVASVTVTILDQTASTIALMAVPRDSSGNQLTGRVVTWSSSDTTIAPIDSTGLITIGVNNGTVTITATCEGITATMTVTVNGVLPPTLTSITPNSVAQGSSAVSLSVVGTRITSDTTLVFSNPGITLVDATPNVNTVALTAHINVSPTAGTGAGTVTLHSPTTGDSVALAFTVTAASVATTVTVSPSSFSVGDNGDTFQLSAATADQFSTAMTGRTYTWTSSNTSIATVSSTGLVTGHTVGTCTITAHDGSLTGTSAATVTVQPLDHLTLTPSVTSMYDTDAPPTLTLAAYQTADSSAPYTDTLSPAASYSSSDPSIIAVNTTTGVCTMGGSDGSVTITVTAGGKSATATITVTQGFTLSTSTSPIYIGTAFTVTATASGSSVTPDSLTSSDTSKVSMDPPTLGTLSPTSITQGASNVAFTLSGCTNLRATDTMALPSGVTMSGYTVTGGGTGATFNLSATAGAATGAKTLSVSNTGHGASGTVALTVAATGANVPTGLSGVGFFAEDFASYANDAACKASGNLSFLTPSGTYGALDTATGDKYNSHNTFNDVSPTDRASSGIGSNSAATGYGNHESITFRATIQWRPGVDYSLGRTLLAVFPKDSALFLVTQYLAQLSIDSSGQYVLSMQLYDASTASIMSTAGSTVLNPAGAEKTSGYTVDYFLRVEKLDTTHVRATVWLAKNTGGVVGTPMLVGTVTKALTAAQAALYLGKLCPDSDGNSKHPAYTVNTAIGIAQFEAIDEAAHADYFNLSAASSYTPLT